MQLGDDSERHRLGARPPSGSPTGARSRGRTRSAGGAELSEQRVAARRRTQKADVADGSRRQCAQVRKVRQQVVAHDDRRIDLPQIEDRRQLVRGGQHDPRRARKVRRDGVGGAMIGESHLPVQPHGELGHRHRIGSRPEDEQARRQGERE